MHLFPKDYASEEVRAALGDIGVDMEGRSEDAREEMPRKGRKEDFVYLEDREEEDAEEQHARGEEVSHSAVIVVCVSEGFSLLLSTRCHRLLMFSRSTTRRRRCRCLPSLRYNPRER
jgi:hypothetical protein